VEYWPKDEKRLSDLVKKNLNVPILFLTGKDNRLFTPKTMETTFNELVRLNPKVKGQEIYQLEIVKGYGHLDLIWGQNAANDIFPIIETFLQKHLT